MDNVDKISDKERFNILCGYFDKKGYHPNGGKAILLEQLLSQISFNSLEDFWQWYDAIPNKEALKKEWQCAGKCCNSLLAQLLEMRGKRERTEAKEREI